MKVLIAPLNWGLGHAARCIPLVAHYCEAGDEVVLAGDGESLVLLKQHFPHLRAIQLPPLQLHYSTTKSQVGALLRQLPKLLNSAFQDHFALQHLLALERFDLVIADNRFGCFTKEAHCVYITHQVCILLPRPWKWAEGLLHHWHARLMKHYNEVWVPDWEGENNLSGDLSHRYPLPENGRYIGPLSRFKACSKSTKALPVYDTIAVLSGLEPQRSLLEQAVVKACEQAPHSKVLIIQGKPKAAFCEIQHQNITFLPYVSDSDLAHYFLTAQHIVARSGYSTIMDLDALGVLSKAILIPTPGQSEQEYLARYLRYRLSSISPTLP